jgi:hypothetical protein
MNGDIVAIPERSSAKLGHITVFEANVIIVPKRIAKVKENSVALNILCFLKRAFTVLNTVKGTIDKLNTVHGV